jgi:TetR/AcrR family transcriptional regulator, cholesterol catabolism regulator
VFVVGALNFTVEWFDPEKGSFDTLADQIFTIIADGLIVK